jgi:hypothetical protein
MGILEVLEGRNTQVYSFGDFLKTIFDLHRIVKQSQQQYYQQKQKQAVERKKFPFLEKGSSLRENYFHTRK